MGLPIAGNLVKAGFRLKVYTRNRKIYSSRILDGSKTADTPKSVVKNCNFLFLCLKDAKAVKETIFGKNGAIDHFDKDCLVVDLSTISPSESREISNELALKGIRYLDAPVTGGTEGAKLGTLSIFAGCEKDDYPDLIPLLESISSKTYFFGAIGKGQEVKALNQILVSGSYLALAETISMGNRLGLPMSKVVEALKGGAGGSWALSNRAENMIRGEYPLGFKVSLHHKDLTIVSELADQLNIELPLTETVRELENALIERGLGDLDISSLKKLFD